MERYIHTDAERAINIEGTASTGPCALIGSVHVADSASVGHVQRRVLDALAKLNATEGAAETDEADEECVPRLMFLEAQMAVAGLMASEPWEEFCAETDLDGTSPTLCLLLLLTHPVQSCAAPRSPRQRSCTSSSWPSLATPQL